MIWYRFPHSDFRYYDPALAIDVGNRLDLEGKLIRMN